MLSKIDLDPKHSVNSFISINLNIIKEDNELHINIPTNVTNKNLNLIIDSAADISLVRADQLIESSKINTKNRTRLTGIALDSHVYSLGTIKMNIIYDNIQITHDFHVISNSYNLKEKIHGIIGYDFLNKFKAKIDFLENKLQLRSSLKDNFFNSNVYDNAKKQANSHIYTLKIADTENEYFEKLEEYEAANVENKFNIYMTKSLKKKKKISNNNYYDILPISYFSRFPSVSIYKIDIEQTNSFASLQPFIYCAKQVDDEPIVIHDRNERQAYLFNKINKENLTSDQLEIVKDLLHEYAFSFYVPFDPNEHTDVIEQHIKLTDEKIINIRQYPVPLKLRPIVQKEIDLMLKRKIIQPCNSPYNSPFLMVKKSHDNNDSYRFVLDCRKLNSITEPISFGAITLEDAVDRLSGAKVFSTIDIKSAYNVVPLSPESRKYTSFTFEFQKYEFVSSLFGARNSGFYFQQFVSIILADLLKENRLILYIDDALIYSSTYEENLATVKEVLRRFKIHNVKANVEKTKLLQEKVIFLSHEISRFGIKPDERRVLPILSFERPKSIKILQRFLGMCTYFRKYINSYSIIALPLFNLIKKDSEYKWTEECQKAFETLKEKLTQPPLLAFPDMNRPFYLFTDASKSGISSILMQKAGNKENVIEYYSKTITPTMQRYSIVELEMLSIVTALKHFRKYLLNNPFTLFTDSKALTYVLSNSTNNAKIFRYKLALSEYDYKIAYVKSKSNVADFLSRCNETNDDSKKILQIKTRSATAKEKEGEKEKQKENENTNENKNEKTKAKAKQNKLPITNPINYDLFYIEERKNIPLKTDDFHFIFYFFDSINCRMHKNLMDKLKTNIDLTKIRIDEIYIFDEKRAILLINQTLISNEQINHFEIILRKVIKFCTNHNYEHIAISIDMKDFQNYLTFKKLLCGNISKTNVNVVLYLNKIIDIYKKEDINKILELYHNKKVSGHFGVSRTLANIKQWYWFPNQRKLVKQYIKRCTTCELNKMTRRNRSGSI